MSDSAVSSPARYPTRKGYWVVMSCISLVAMFAVVEMLYITKYGVWVGGDSLYYIGAAVGLMQGNGYATCFSGSPAPVISWPPGYSICLALLAQFLGDPSIAARWLNSFCFGMNTWLMGWLILRFIGWYPRAAILSSLFFALHWRFISLHALAFSEALFLSCSFLGVAVFFRYLESGRLPVLCVSAAMFSLAMLTRMFGLTFIAAGALVLLVFERRSRHTRLLRMLIFSAIALAPVSAFLIRNLALTKAATTVPMDAIYLPPVDCAAGLMRFTLGLVWPYEFNFTAKTKCLLYSGWYCLMAVIVLQVILAIRRKTRTDRNLFAVFMGLFVCSYLGLFGYMVISNIECQEAGTMHRYLMPLVPYLLLLVSSLVLARYNTARPLGADYWLRVVTIGASALVLLGCVKVMWSCYSAQAVEGHQFSGKNWRTSQLVGFARDLHTNTIIYANRADALWFYTRRPIQPLPQYYDMNHGCSADGVSYSNAIANITKQLARDGGYVFVFTNTFLHMSETQNAIIDSACRSAHKLPLNDGTVYEFKRQ